MKPRFHHEYHKEVSAGPVEATIHFRIRQLDSVLDELTSVDIASDCLRQHADEPLIDVFETEDGLVVIVEIPADQEIRVEEEEDGIIISSTSGFSKHVRIARKYQYQGMVAKRRNRVLYQYPGMVVKRRNSVLEVQFRSASKRAL